MTTKAPGLKANNKKRRTRVLTKRRYKVRIIAQPIPTTPTPAAPVNSTQTAPTPTVATASTQMLMVKSTAASIPMMMYNLAKGKFDEVPYSTGRPHNEGNPSVHNSNPPPLEDIPSAPVRQDTPWPSIESASKNLFKIRKYWPIPPTPASTVKTEVPP